MTSSIVRSVSSRQLLARILDTPNLVEAVRAMPLPAFTSLVRQVGVEDLGEVIALASTEQIVAAFDEDLFRNDHPGERERFEPTRFATWLEVLLEAGENAAADRVAELSEDFVAHALHGLLIVLEHDALRDRLQHADDEDAAELADKAIESALSEEIDGYVLLAREHTGWDAVLTLVLALDQHHRAFLVRVLDLCVEASRSTLDDLDELVTALQTAEALAEDVEGERMDRRAALGYVEPRAARNFLTLARQPVAQTAASIERDPITRAYFRDLDRERTVGRALQPDARSRSLDRLAADLLDATLVPAVEVAASTKEAMLLDALRELQTQEPSVFDQRMEELAYLTNVLVAGGESGKGRYRPADAAREVLRVVARGAVSEAQAADVTRRQTRREQLVDVLRLCSADRLFRIVAKGLC